jgi:hypothetical protein
MRSRTRLIAAAVITAALAAGSAGAAVASTTGTKPAAPPNTVSAGKKPAAGSDVPGEPGGSKGAGAKAAAAKSAARPGTDPFPAAVAGVLHVSTARANTALRPLLTAGTVDPSSREFAAAARSLGVSPQQLAEALAQAKQSLAAGK